MLSRLPTADEIDMNQVFEFETSEFDSDSYKELRDVVAKNQERLPDLKIIDNMVFKKSLASYDPETQEFQWKLWVPVSLTHELIKQAHEKTTSAHGGISKSLYRLREKYYWPQMGSQIRQYVSKCSILAMVDHYTKFTFLKAMREATASDVVKFIIEDIYRKFGVPETVHSDNGAQFISKTFKDMIETYGINYIQTAPYAPQSNASERVNQSVLCDDQKVVALIFAHTIKQQNKKGYSYSPASQPLVVMITAPPTLEHVVGACYKREINE
ncbi:uncharacterized protein LOC133334777 [Musca vetustissima]|uniref:uncharacterized protein LOC133334777 n=1 Tax=Musca vetustissima TaxID=27455 RepID=UPI002AB6B93D|nr:uncharacterized protein LOC133334777 [Musca vetustissima]